MANYSELVLLNYPSAGSPVLIMVLFSMIGLSATAIMLYVILKYDTFVNRHPSLVTKTYNITEWVNFLYIPLVAFEIVIILTGISFHPYICTGYVWQEYVLGHLFLLATSMEAVVHYFFVVKSSRFLIIKDDLLCSFFWRSILAVSIISTGRYFMGRNKMPRTYHFCTGTTPNKSGQYPLEAKCDEDNEQYELVGIIVCMAIFFTFSIAVCIENIRQRRSMFAIMSESITRPGSRQLFIDNIGFIVKMVNAIFGCCVQLAYHNMDIEQLVTFPGNMIFYCYHLWMFPVTTITERMRRFWVDRHLQIYLKRMKRSFQSVGPMDVID